MSESQCSRILAEVHEGGETERGSTIRMVWTGWQPIDDEFTGYATIPSSGQIADPTTRGNPTLGFGGTKYGAHPANLEFKVDTRDLIPFLEQTRRTTKPLDVRDTAGMTAQYPSLVVR